MTENASSTARPDVAFVFSNPRHHVEMMAPVADELRSRGVASTFISLAELRGFTTPPELGAHRVIPLQLRQRGTGGPAPASAPASPRASSSLKARLRSTIGAWRPGRLAQRVVWRAIAPRLRWLLRGARVIVVPNDAVYPYYELLQAVQTPTVLMQEGIRFEMADGYAGPRYGSVASAAVCAWGEGSKAYFLASGAPEARIAITGAPRLDRVDIDAWRRDGQALLAKLGLATAPLAFLSNPIEHQGYGTREAKLALFRQFLDGAAPVLRAHDVPVLVKNHLYEDPDDYARIAAASPLADRVTIMREGSIFAAIAASRAAVVLTSTVGLEALTCGLPLGVLEIPGHDFAFDYVQRGAAVPVRISDIAGAVERLLAPAPSHRETGAAFVAYHLHDQGHARRHVADVIERVRAGLSPTAPARARAHA